MSDKLANSQKRFISSITSGDFDEKFMEGMVPLGKLNPLKAMQVYRGDYTARLQEALGDTYESIWAVLGDEDFTHLAQDFIQKHNSTSFDLGQYGKEFPEFIKQHSLLKETPFLFDLAYFEREFMRVFHAPVRKGLGPEAFQKIENPFELKLYLGQEYFLFKSDFPIRDIWHARKDENEPDLDWSKTESLIIFKGSESISTRELTPLQFQILEELQSGKTLEESLVAASDRIKNFQESEISELFGFLVNDGLITQIK